MGVFKYRMNRLAWCYSKRTKSATNGCIRRRKVDEEELCYVASEELFKGKASK